jgi:transcriptional regulator GlxA family with amidase domain
MSSPAPNQPREPITVAILAFAETSASVVFGIYDLLASAGRDWPLLIDGVPGQSRIRPVIVSRHPGPFEAANGVTIIPQRGLDNANPPRIIFVSEVNLPPGAELAQRFRAEIDWLKHCFEAGSTIATACAGAMLLAQAACSTGTRPPPTGRGAMC